MKYPDTPEGAALFLMTLVLESRRVDTKADPMTRAEILALYAHCLRVAKGEDVTRNLPSVTDRIH